MIKNVVLSVPVVGEVSKEKGMSIIRNRRKTKRDTVETCAPVVVAIDEEVSIIFQQWNRRDDVEMV